MNFFVRAFNNYDTDAASENAAYVSDKPSVTVQADKNDADINVIVNRWLKTGLIPQSARLPTYGDFTSAPADYQEALTRISDARDAFSHLPAAVRKRFDNDPAAYVEFCSDPDNRQEMIDMGLLDKPVDSTDNSSAVSSSTSPESTDVNQSSTP